LERGTNNAAQNPKPGTDTKLQRACAKNGKSKMTAFTPFRARFGGLVPGFVFAEERRQLQGGNNKNAQNPKPGANPPIKPGTNPLRR
jgi:hypothetical protein